MTEEQATKIIEALEVIGGLMAVTATYAAYCLGVVVAHYLRRWRRWIDGDPQQPQACRRKQ